jgi:hypothetical protein
MQVQRCPTISLKRDAAHGPSFHEAALFFQRSHRTPLKKATTVCLSAGGHAVALF